ncbi:MAG: hypothetical protein M3275_02980 [Thermoproteota archaeon]|nr:hypothetical protein [Thermoproteota archaeon]
MNIFLSRSIKLQSQKKKKRRGRKMMTELQNKTCKLRFQIKATMYQVNTIEPLLAGDKLIRVVANLDH